MIGKEIISINASLVALVLLTKLYILVGIIVCGSLVYASLENQKARHTEYPHSIYDIIASILVGVFSGFMVFLMAISISDDWVTAWLAAGIGSYSGVNGLISAKKRLFDAFGNK